MASIKGNEELIVAGVVSAIEITNLNDDEVKGLTEVYRSIQRRSRVLSTETRDDQLRRFRREWLAGRLRNDKDEARRFPGQAWTMPLSEEDEMQETAYKHRRGISDTDASGEDVVQYRTDDRRFANDE